MICTPNEGDYHWLKSLRAHGWCRELPDEFELYNKTGSFFKDSFTFVTPGYSVRPLEMSGAIVINCKAIRVSTCLIIEKTIRTQCICTKNQRQCANTAKRSGKDMARARPMLGTSLAQHQANTVAYECGWRIGKTGHRHTH